MLNPVENLLLIFPCRVRQQICTQDLRTDSCSLKTTPTFAIEVQIGRYDRAEADWGHCRHTWQCGIIEKTAVGHHVLASIIQTRSRAPDGCATFRDGGPSRKLHVLHVRTGSERQATADGHARQCSPIGGFAKRLAPVVPFPTGVGANGTCAESRKHGRTPYVHGTPARSPDAPCHSSEW